MTDQLQVRLVPPDSELVDTAADSVELPHGTLAVRYWCPAELQPLLQ
jgi:hypothetical protein